MESGSPAEMRSRYAMISAAPCSRLYWLRLVASTRNKSMKQINASTGPLWLLMLEPTLSEHLSAFTSHMEEL